MSKEKTISCSKCEAHVLGVGSILTMKDGEKVCLTCLEGLKPSESESAEDKYREAFSSEFYSLWAAEGFGETDAHAGSDYPWGLPWSHTCGEDVYKKSGDPEKDAALYFDDYKGEIADYQRQERELDETAERASDVNRAQAHEKAIKIIKDMDLSKTIKIKTGE